MSYIKPTIQEQLFLNFFKLEPDRPYYYLLVYRVARNIFISMGDEEKVTEMEDYIRETIEMPMEADFQSIIFAYYDMRFIMKNKAYCVVGDSVTGQQITRLEIMRMLEKVRNWIYDEVIMMSHEVRFTKPNEIYT